MDYIIFKADGSIKEQYLKRYIQQGSTGVDHIFIGYPDGLDTDICQAVFTLPNQTTNTELGEFYDDFPYEADDPFEAIDDPDYDGDTCPGWVITLTTDQTTYDGVLCVAVRVIRTHTVLVNYPFTLVINETGVRPDTDSGVTIEELDSYLRNLQLLITEAVQENTDDYLSATSENPVQNKVVTGALNIKADKVGPLPSYEVNVISDNVLNFITNNNVSNKPIIIKTQIGDFIGEFKHTGYSNYTFEFESLSNSERYYGAEIDMTGRTFSSLLDGTYHKPFEEMKNKVTSLSFSSTNVQYPSAKCVFDMEQNLREVAEGKCKCIVLAYDAVAPENDYAARYFKKLDGTSFSSLSDFNTYVSGLTLKNSDFHSDNNSINLTSCYIITTNDVVILQSEFVGLLKTGDIFLVTNTDVPDRWVEAVSSSTMRLDKLETSKVEISNMVTTDTDQTITGIKTFTDKIEVQSPDGNEKKLIHMDNNASLYIGTSTANPDLVLGGGRAATLSVLPITNATYNLGSSSYNWKDAYLSGNLQLQYSGRNDSVKLFSPSWGGLMVSDQSGNKLLHGYKSGAQWFVSSGGNNECDLGATGQRWKNAYIAGTISDGTNSTSVANINDNFAPIYDDTATYAVGDKVIYGGKLYKCSTAITTAEDWDSTHWTAVSVSGGYVDLDTNQTISGKKSFLSTAFEVYYPDKPTQPLSFGFDNNISNSEARITYLNTRMITMGANLIKLQKNTVPYTNNTYDLGSSSLKWKNLYLSATVYCDKINASYLESRIIAQNNIIANNGNQDLGEGKQGDIKRSFRDLHINRNIVDDDGNSVTVAQLAQAAAGTLYKHNLLIEDTNGDIHYTYMISSTSTQLTAADIFAQKEKIVYMIMCDVSGSPAYMITSVSQSGSDYNLQVIGITATGTFTLTIDTVSDSVVTL